MSKLSISVVIPVSDSANVEFLSSCISSITKQIYKPIELVIVGTSYKIDEVKSRGFESKLDGIRLNLVRGNFTKSQARNVGIRKSKGKYILHIDVDYVLHPEILSKCVDLVEETKVKAIVLYETITKPKSIWQKARKMERDLVSDLENLSAPQLIEKKILNQIEGFDEEVDELDDWALLMKLKAVNAKIGFIKNPRTSVDEPTNVVKIIQRRFRKGRYLKVYKSKYSLKQLSPDSLFSAYTINYKLIIQNPFIFLALVALKVFDTIPFWIGYLFPKERKIDLAKSYKQESVVHSFIHEQNSIYGKFKSRYEIVVLNKILKNIQAKTALELGCGTGRITRVLVGHGIKVQPTDVSESMLEFYKEDKSLPSPILIKSSRLPFQDASYDLVIAFRVIWHISDQKVRENLFREAVRVSKKYVLIDLTTPSRLPINSSSDYVFSESEIERLCEKLDLKIKCKYWLPLGRSLILFRKIDVPKV